MKPQAKILRVRFPLSSLRVSLAHCCWNTLELLANYRNQKYIKGEITIVHSLKGLLLSVGLTLFVAGAGFAQRQDDPAKSAPLPTGWQIFSLGSTDAFKIAMPRKPDSRTEDISNEGISMKATYHIADNDDIFTTIADIHNLPLTADDMTEENRVLFFDKIRDGLVEGVKEGLEKNGLKLEMKFLAQKRITYKGMSGFEQDLTLGDFKGRTRMLPKKDHIMIFFTLLMPTKDESLMVSFMDSFEFVGG